jgi:hypothetical protein
LRNVDAVAMAPPAMASITTLSLLLLLAADIRAPVKAPPSMAFFCNGFNGKTNTVRGKVVD